MSNRSSPALLSPPKPSGIEGLPDDACCLGCRYPLRGLTRNQCPECGRYFDPLRRSTFGPRLRPRVSCLHPRRLLYNIDQTAGADLAIVACIGTVSLWRIFYPFGFSLGIACWSVALSLVFARWCDAGRGETVFVRRDRRVFVAALLLLMLRYTWYAECPHARCIGVLFFPIYVEGTPCRNAWRAHSVLPPFDNPFHVYR